MVLRREKADPPDAQNQPGQTAQPVRGRIIAAAPPMTVQAVFTEWIKTQGMWAVLFVMVISYAKPTLDKFVSTHFELVEQLKQDAKYTLETRKDQAAMLQEIKNLTQSNSQLLQQMVNEKLRLQRDPASSPTNSLNSLELPKTQIPSLGSKYGIN